MTFGLCSGFNVYVIQKVNAPITVLSISNYKKGLFEPLEVFWDGFRHKVTKIGYHHKYFQGKTLFHVFSINCDSTFFKINLNTDTLLWKLEEYSDGEVN